MKMVVFWVVVWHKFTDILEVHAVSIVRALMVEAASTSETSVNFYQTTRRNNPEDNHLNFYTDSSWTSSFCGWLFIILPRSIKCSGFITSNEIL
jgi:hypothetical protein